MRIQTIYRHHDDDWYRIPSLLTASDGSLLAFASRRKGNCEDFGHDTDVVLRRSTDGGASWSEMQTLVSVPDTDIHHGPAVLLRESGRIIKLCRYWPASDDPMARVGTTPYSAMRADGYIDHLLISDDHGVTWSEPRPVVIDFPEHAVSCGTGNGVHGIELSGGRLLVQGGYCLPAGAGGPHDLQRYICIIYSDDGGESWRLGAHRAFNTVREFTMAEWSDGSVYVNLRNHSESGYRAACHSRDRGISFGAFEPVEELPDPFCHAGLAALPGEPPIFAFSNPAVRNSSGQYEHASRRKLTLRLSHDGGRTWPDARLITEAPAAYSDLASTGTSVVHCLFETGENGPYERIDLATLAIA